MIANSQALAFTKNTAFEAVLEYKENNARVFTNFSSYTFKAQIRSARTLTGVLQATLTVTSVGLGQLKVALSQTQTNAIAAGNYVWDLLASPDNIVEPVLMFTGNATCALPVVVAAPTYATQWESDAPTTTITPVEGLYNANQSVVLTVNDANAKIYYSTNGSVPTTLYSVAIPVSSTTTVKFRAVDTAGNEEAVKTAVITIDKVAPVTTCSVASDATITTITDITLSADEPATTYYTTNGDTPTISSTQYAGAFQLAEGTYTIKYFSKDTAGNSETRKSVTGIIVGV